MLPYLDSILPLVVLNEKSAYGNIFNTCSEIGTLQLAELVSVY